MTNSERSWLEAWRRAGPALERIRCEELRRLDHREMIAAFEREWAGARLVRDQAATADYAARAFSFADGQHAPLPLLLRGTNFQIQVWRALLRIPWGSIATYGDVARSLEPESPGATRAVRAVAAACGTNPVSYVIPCHRVIQSTGALCGYGWGLDKKRALLALEAH